MNTVEKEPYAHCRLCATLKSCVELVNLVIKEEMRNLILNKLNRFNINLNFNITDDRLPWTICLTCINSLDKAFDFVLEVEEAQKVLENLIDVKDIKTEIQVSDDDLYESSSQVLDVNIKIKSENDTQFPTAEVKTEVLKTREPTLKSVEDPDCDTQLRKTNHTCTGNETFITPEELAKHSNSYNKDLQIRQPPPVAKEVLNNGTCTICQKSYKNIGSLRSHLLIHKHSHTCQKCGKIFPGKRYLARHMTTHDDRRPFSCEICKSRYRTSGQLRYHVATHDDKPFKCDQCGRCFRLRKQLMDHSIIHTDSMPYVCTYCNKGFSLKNSHNRHIRRQHTELVKPYFCQQCKRQFFNRSDYNKHMKRRHRTNMAKKKCSPKGVYPIEPVTGEMITYEETDNVEENVISN